MLGVEEIPSPQPLFPAGPGRGAFRVQSRTLMSVLVFRSGLDSGLIGGSSESQKVPVRAETRYSGSELQV